MIPSMNRVCWVWFNVGLNDPNRIHPRSEREADFGFELSMCIKFSKTTLAPAVPRLNVLCVMDALTSEKRRAEREYMMSEKERESMASKNK
jgi:hypothetical protein